MVPIDPMAGETVVMMVTGLSGRPGDEGIGLTIDGRRAKIDVLYDASRGKLTISVPTGRQDRIIVFSVDDPNGVNALVGTLTLFQ